MRLMGTVGPMARHAEDLDLGLGVLAPDAPPPSRVPRVAVFEEDGLQPVSAAASRAEAGHRRTAQLSDSGSESRWIPRRECRFRVKAAAPLPNLPPPPTSDNPPLPSSAGALQARDPMHGR
jgi:hypothetical protein